ncbi:MAG: HupE/UreJ family protein [Pseudomonadota bacterium]
MKLGYVTALPALLFTEGASAHTLGAKGLGFYQGFIHPLVGFDHLLVMLAVGMWAAQVGGRARWLIPCAFMMMLALGAAAAVTGWPLPQVELGIASSIVLSGLLIATAARIPLVWAVGVVGLFALFHGHAHGAEMPQAATPWVYAMGFMLSTGALHGLGVVMGMMHSYCWPARLLRLGGAGVVTLGVWFLAGL